MPLLLLLLDVSDEVVVVDVLSVVEVVLEDAGELLLADDDGEALLELLFALIESVDELVAGVDAEADAPIPLVLAEPLMEAEGPEAPVH